MKDLSPWLQEHKQAIIIVAALALVARLVVFTLMLNQYGGASAIVSGGPQTTEQLQYHDANIAGDCYYEMSLNVLNGRGLSCNLLPPFEAYNYGLPLYPFVIASVLFITHSYYVVLFLQMLLSVFTALVGMYLADRILPWASASLCTGLFLALEPNHILSSVNFSSESLFMPLFFGFLLFFFRYLEEEKLQNLLWGACLLGLAALVKSTVQYLPLLLIVFVLWQHRYALNRRLFKNLAYFIAIFMLVLSPWIYYNYTQFSVVSLSTQAVRNPFMALLPSVISLHTGQSFDEAQQEVFKVHANNFTFENSKGITRYTFGELVKYPREDIEIALISVTTFFTADYVATLFDNIGIAYGAHLSHPALVTLVRSPATALRLVFTYLSSPVAFILAARMLFILISALFVYGIYAIYRSKKGSVLFNFAVLLVCYFAFTTISNGYGVTARFRMPVEVFILAIAYAGVLLLSGNRKQRGN